MSVRMVASLTQYQAPCTRVQQVLAAVTLRLENSWLSGCAEHCLSTRLPSSANTLGITWIIRSDGAWSFFSKAARLLVCAVNHARKAQ